MAVAYDVIAATGTYQKDGQEKKRWSKIGIVLQGNKGLSLKLENIPVGWDGWATLAEPRPVTAIKKDDDDLPF